VSTRSGSAAAIGQAEEARGLDVSTRSGSAAAIGQAEEARGLDAAYAAPW
jgi:hypothetical protein